MGPHREPLLLVRPKKKKKARISEDRRAVPETLENPRSRGLLSRCLKLHLSGLRGLSLITFVGLTSASPARAAASLESAEALRAPVPATSRAPDPSVALEASSASDAGHVSEELDPAVADGSHELTTGTGNNEEKDAKKDLRVEAGHAGPGAALNRPRGSTTGVSAGAMTGAWRHCVPGLQTCTRPRPARWLLGALGLTVAGAGTAYLLVVGDSLRAGDPGGLLAGGGVAAFGGALLGGVIGLMGTDRPGDQDRVRPATFALDYASGGPPRLDERHPGELNVRFAPNYFLPDGAGRIRLFGHVGGSLGREREVDPRPQFSEQLAGQTGTQPFALEEKRLSLGIGADLAVALPYPLLRRSTHLGAAEIRWRPEVEIRRHRYGGRLIERTMLLPLTVGLRWYLSPRQRFTIYVGPRLDFSAQAIDGSLDRGPPNIGSLYGEVWYDIDVPLRIKPAARARARARINGMFTFGYVHSRFDGLGINFAAAYGYFGSAYAGWLMRIRPRSNPVAVQLGFGAWIGTGVSAVFSAGVVLPDLGRRR